MTKFLGPRLGGALVTLWIVLTVVFLLGAVIGDPVNMLLGESAMPEQVAALRESMGFNRPLYQQYGSYLADLVTGDLGESIRYHRPNLDLVMERLPHTVRLAGAAMLLALAVGVPLGILAAWKEGSAWDRAAVSISVFFQSMPVFWLGLMLVLIVSVNLGWAPAGGVGSFSHLILPAVTLATHPTAYIVRVMRGSMCDVLEEEYITSARARGLRESVVVLGHAVRNASLPLVTLIGLQAGVLLSGAVTTEFVFAWPGIGTLAVDAISNRDVTLVQAVVLTGAIAFIVINVVVDALYGAIDPRIRESR